MTHRFDDGVGVFGSQANGIRVDIRKFLEQHRLAFHDRHGRFRADVAQPQHRRTIADNGNRVAFDGQLPSFAAIFRNGLTDPSDTGRVSHRESIPGRHWDFVVDGNLPAEMEQENLVGNMDHFDLLNLPNGIHDFTDVVAVPGPHADVARHGFRVRRNNVHRAHIAAVSANGLDNSGEHADLIGIRQTHRKAVADRRS